MLNACNFPFSAFLSGCMLRPILGAGTYPTADPYGRPFSTSYMPDRHRVGGKPIANTVFCLTERRLTKTIAGCFLDSIASFRKPVAALFARLFNMLAVDTTAICFTRISAQPLRTKKPILLAVTSGLQRTAKTPCCLRLAFGLTSAYSLTGCTLWTWLYLRT